MLKNNVRKKQKQVQIILYCYVMREFKDKSIGVFYEDFRSYPNCYFGHQYSV